MTEYVLDQNGHPVVKKKKKHTGLKIFLIVLLVIIVLPIALAYALLYDGNTKQTEVSSDFSITEYANTIMTDSLDFSLDENPRASIRVGDVLFDNLLSLALQKLPSAATSVVKKAYVQIYNNDTYEFYVDLLGYPIFKSRLKLVTTLTQSPNKDTLYLTITDIAIGRLGGLTWVATSFLSDSLFNDLFKNAGLSIKCDLANKRFSYKVEDLFADIANFITGDSKLDSEMIINIAKEFSLNKLLYVHTVDNKLSIDMDLSKIETNSYVNPLWDFITLKDGITIDDIVAQMKSDLKDGSLSPDHNACKAYFESKYQNAIEGIEDVKKDPKFFEKAIVNSTKISGTPQTGITGSGSLAESIFNKFIRASAIMGEAFLFKYKDKKGDYKINYIAIDNAYVDIYNSHLYIVIKLNINGFRTTMSCISELETSNDQFQLRFNIKEIDYGEIKSTKHLMDTVKKFVHDAFISGTILDGTISVDTDGDNFAIIVNYIQGIEAALKQAGLSIVDRNKIEFKGSNIVGQKGDDGHVDVSFAYKI